LLLLLLFITKSPGGYAIYRRNSRALEMQNFTPAYMKGWTWVRTDVRTIFSELKFLGCTDNHIFLPMVLRFSRARAPLKTNRFHVDNVAGAGFFRAKEEKTTASTPYV